MERLSLKRIRRGLGYFSVVKNGLLSIFCNTMSAEHGLA